MSSDPEREIADLNRFAERTREMNERDSPELDNMLTDLAKAFEAVDLEIAREAEIARLEKDGRLDPTCALCVEEFYPYYCTCDTCF